MNHKNQSDKQSMTSLQRQAVLVCVVCALAALLTVGITLTLLKRGKPETPGTPADSVQTDTTGDVKAQILPITIRSITPPVLC